MNYVFLLQYLKRSAYIYAKVAYVKHGELCAARMFIQPLEQLHSYEHVVAWHIALFNCHMVLIRDYVCMPLERAHQSYLLQKVSEHALVIPPCRAFVRCKPLLVKIPYFGLVYRYAYMLYRGIIGRAEFIADGFVNLPVAPFAKLFFYFPYSPQRLKLMYVGHIYTPSLYCQALSCHMRIAFI